MQNLWTFHFSIYFSFAKYIVVGGTQSCLAKCKVHSIKLQSRWWNRALVVLDEILSKGIM
jgi:hypothetical protein